MPSDSSKPDFWNTRFRGAVMPWDARGVPARLAAWIRNKAPLRVLIPGAGTAYEVRLFAQHGHDVIAIDFSDAAIEAAHRELGELSILVHKADFFALAQRDFDLMYERAFLCALPRRRWPDWARRAAELVRPGGELAGFFYLDDNERGPPFGISRAGLNQLLEPHFTLAEDSAIPPEQSLPVFKAKEIWQVWQRRL